MRCLTFTNFVNSSISLNFDFDIFQLFGVDLLELELKSLFWNIFRFDLHKSSSEIACSVFVNFGQVKLTKSRITSFSESNLWGGAESVLIGKVLLVSITSSLKFSFVKFELMSKCVDSWFSSSLIAQIFNNSAYHFRMVFGANHILAFNHELFKFLIF